MQIGLETLTIESQQLGKGIGKDFKRQGRSDCSGSILANSWFTTLIEMMTQEPLVIEPNLNNLQLPNQPGERHPLWRNLKLIIGRLSGNIT